MCNCAAQQGTDVGIDILEENPVLHCLLRNDLELPLTMDKEFKKELLKFKKFTVENLGFTRSVECCLFQKGNREILRSIPKTEPREKRKSAVHVAAQNIERQKGFDWAAAAEKWLREQEEFAAHREQRDALRFGRDPVQERIRASYCENSSEPATETHSYSSFSSKFQS